MNPKTSAIGFSLLVHLIAFGVLVFSFSRVPEQLGVSQKQVETVEAVVVDDKRVQEELRRLKTQERSQREAEDARQRRVKEELEAARKAKEAEDQRLAELKQKREQEQREADKQRKELAELKAQQAAMEKQRQEEQKRLADAEKKRKAEEARLAKLESEKKLRAAMEAEKKALAAQRSQELGRMQNAYIAEIASKVKRNWLRPPGTGDNFQCAVIVRQLPGGEVMSAEVTESCGNPVLDRSVEAAVLKSSPLPLPADPTLFEREIKFIFKPR